MHAPDTPQGPSQINWRVLAISAAFIAAFCLASLIDAQRLAGWVDLSFAWSARYFGLYWQFLMLATFLIGLGVAALPGARRILGNIPTPEFGLFKWVSMVMCTLLAGGGVFWAAGEPLAHFFDPSPIFDDVEGGTRNAAGYALAQAFLHWGFLAWAILGSLTTVVLMHYHYDCGLPLAPRTLLYPVFGRRAIDGVVGDIADACSAIAVVAGTVGPIGFLGLQVGYGLETLFGIPDGFTTQALVVAALMAVYLTSAVSGVGRGIQILSRANMILGGALLAFILIAGPTLFIAESFAVGLVRHLQHFLPLALQRGDAGWFGPPGWLAYWTVFFWGWFIGYGPLMAIFIARVSRGRSMRSVILMVSVIAPVVTMVWFTILGGAGIGLEIRQPGVVADAMEGFNLPAALLVITEALPFGFIVSILFLLLTTIFVATTGDSMTYSLSVTLANSDHPPTALRVFWGLAMGTMALLLLSMGSGGIGKLQSFIVVTAVPVSLLLLPALWSAPAIALATPAREPYPRDT